MSHNILKVLNPCIKLIGALIVILSFFLPYNRELFVYELTLMFGVVLLSNISINEFLLVINKLKVILLIIFIIIFRLGYEWNYIILYSVKVVIWMFYYYVLFKSFTMYDLSKSSTRLIDVFNFLNLNMKKLNNKIYLALQYINIGYNYYREYIILDSIKGYDYQYKGFFYKLKYPIVIFKYLKKDCKKRVKEIDNNLKYRNYSFEKDVYKYNKRLLLCDYLYLLLHLMIIIIYIWRIRV